MSTLIVATGTVHAHDFWVQPQAFQVQPVQATPLTLQVGHGPYRQRSPIALQRIVRFQVTGPSDRSVDLHGALHLGDVAGDGDVALPRAGTYLLALETDNRAQSHLPSLRFNDYLTVEGLTPAWERRRREGRMDVDETEIYSRHAKAIMQSGPFDTAAQASVTAPLGLTLEIVPDINPYALPRPRTLPVRVFYQGHALPGATVKFTDLDHDDAPVEVHVTDAAGRASFAMPTAGRWLLNTIWIRALPTDAEADYETDFSSLSFGFL
ncbi:hypothetical protein J2T07_001032 [Luteibacter jiangsuensis]|uniref:GH25 family protein n=1 Tax=Luteibacter jiangsuensis TaxID=637577 RepID=A0ABT9SX37_9GAMM|nr:DUF4198 domain-containing protein [Luteibacter jiangsuensis]MDQ0008873.1 hypothetical protein [Luteibacter jiangsuensis]